MSDAYNEKTDKMLSDLHNFLLNRSVESNRISLADFAKFMPLFSEKKDSEDMNDLTVEFTQRFDIYENITIVDNDDKEIITLPRIFVPVRSISEKFDSVVGEFHSNSKTEIPKYIADSTEKMLRALVASQASSKKDYAKIIMAYNADFKRLMSKQTPQEADEDLEDDELDWS
jgi:hypothetical protein